MAITPDGKTLYVAYEEAMRVGVFSLPPDGKPVPQYEAKFDAYPRQIVVDNSGVAYVALDNRCDGNVANAYYVGVVNPDGTRLQYQGPKPETAGRFNAIEVAGSTLVFVGDTLNPGQYGGRVLKLKLTQTDKDSGTIEVGAVQGAVANPSAVVFATDAHGAELVVFSSLAGIGAAFVLDLTTLAVKKRQIELPGFDANTDRDESFSVTRCPDSNRVFICLTANSEGRGHVWMVDDLATDLVATRIYGSLVPLGQIALVAKGASPLVATCTRGESQQFSNRIGLIGTDPVSQNTEFPLAVEKEPFYLATGARLDRLFVMSQSTGNISLFDIAKRKPPQKKRPKAKPTKRKS
jgi:DNA-binding beta-propeller fold protein YncE